MIIELISFGFKTNSIPDTNHLIDVRFLNNPFYVDELRELTGFDEEVINFFKEDPTVNEFLENLFNWIEYILNTNKSANKEKIIIAIGCTGGQHRSPYITECLAKYLTEKSTACSEISINHRELKKYNILRTRQHVS
jgi:UPF0042 nucleotide-binding protein